MQRPLTIVGGGRDAPVVVRRGRRKAVCARGASLALLFGPSTSPLGRNDTLAFSPGSVPCAQRSRRVHHSLELALASRPPRQHRNAFGRAHDRALPRSTIRASTRTSPSWFPALMPLRVLPSLACPLASLGASSFSGAGWYSWPRRSRLTSLLLSLLPLPSADSQRGSPQLFMCHSGGCSRWRSSAS